MENHRRNTDSNPSAADQRVYFVPLRWWKDAQDMVPYGAAEGESGKAVVYVATSASSYTVPLRLINIIFSSDLVFNLKREEAVAAEREYRDGEAVTRDGNGEVVVSGWDFALVSGEMWVRALKWHSDSKASLKGNKNLLAIGDDMSDVYPLQLRLSISKETNSLSLKICKKDNTGEPFKRACWIFGVNALLLCIYDFSGHIKQYFLNGCNGFTKDYQKQPDLEVVLEMQIYGLSDSMKCREGIKDEKGLSYCNGSSSGPSNQLNGSAKNGGFGAFHGNLSGFSQSSEGGSVGLT